MALNIIHTGSEQVVPQVAQERLRAQTVACGHATLLMPSLDQALAAQRALAGGPLAWGVDSSTCAAWARERWGAYGDGAKVVDGAARIALMHVALEQSAAADELGPLLAGPGTLSLLARVAREALAWLPPAPGAVLPQGLSEGERAACAVLTRYARLLEERRLCEPSHVARWLPARLAASDAAEPLVALCDDALPEADLRLLAGMAACTDVTLVACASDGPAGELVRDVCVRLAEAAREAGAAVEEARDAASAEPAPARAAELQRVRDRVFCAGASGVEDVRPDGAVWRLEPAGPSAESEAVAQAIVTAAAQGCERVTVVLPRGGEGGRALADKLGARGLRVRTQELLSPCACEPGAVFLAFLRAIARLQRLADVWPGRLTLDDESFDPREALADGPVAADAPLAVDVAGLERQERRHLGDMGWWPPREISDFLLSDLSGVPADRAWALDARWRGNRVLGPQDVLALLRRSSLSSLPTAQALQRLLERGSVAGAARELSQALARRAQGAPLPVQEGFEPLVEPQTDPAYVAQSTAVLDAIAGAARTLGSLGIRNELERGADEGAYALEDYLDLLEQAADARRVCVRRELGPADARCLVQLVDARSASRQVACSQDALFYLGLTTQESPVPRSDGAADLLLAKLGVGGAPDPLPSLRASFWRVLGVPTRQLVLVRDAHDEKSAPTYPAVMLSELCACYALPEQDGQGKRGIQGPPLLSARGEDLISQNLSVTGTQARAQDRTELPATGELSEASRSYVVLPTPGAGAAEDAERLPVLSATQLETYLDCPYKWFTARRLGLGALDAGFSGLEKGSFVHRVLELARRELLREAVLAQPAEQRSAYARWVLEHPDGSTVPPGLTGVADPLPGSRITDDTLAHAQELLDRYFVIHLEHQYLSATTLRSQGLIPHRASERFDLVALRDDLASALAFERRSLAGFEPRFFELPFGRGDAPTVAYAGARFTGTIDRVDVDAQGRALIIDYKHKKDLFDEYALFGKEETQSFELPRHVQTLVYAQALRQLLPDLEVAGVIYLGTRRNARGGHDLAGAVSGALVEQVMGGLSDTRRMRVSVPGERAGAVGIRSFSELLERSEEQLTDVVARMMAGRIEASPRGAEGDRAYAYVCNWCPVASCERRRS